MAAIGSNNARRFQRLGLHMADELARAVTDFSLESLVCSNTCYGRRGKSSGRSAMFIASVVSNPRAISVRSGMLETHESSACPHLSLLLELRPRDRSNSYKHDALRRFMRAFLLQ